MRNLWPFGRHRKWRDAVGAYVDGELGVEHARRFEAHLARCETCTHAVAAARDVKRLTMALPTLRAPRSFQLTPGMLVEERRVPRSAGRPVLARLAQATAAVAAVAFAAVLVADLNSSDDEGGPSIEAAREYDSGAGTLQSTTDDTRNAAPASGGGATVVTPAIPEVGATLGAAGNPGGTPQSPATNDQALSGAQTLQPEQSIDKSSHATPGTATDALGDAVTVSADDDDGSGFNALVALEVALASVAVVAAGTWAVTRRK